VRLSRSARVAGAAGAITLALLLAGESRAASGSAATAPRTVALDVKITGRGTVWVGGKQALVCQATVLTPKTCRHTFHVPRGQRIKLKALLFSGGARWKLATWAGACKGSAPSCSLKLKTRASVAATFVPPGDRLNPYSVGKAVTLPSVSIEGSWRLTVNSATINADAAVEAVIDPYTQQPANGPPPPGAQYTLVNISATYVGGGSSYLGDFVGDIEAEGARNAGYIGDGACVPPSPDIGNNSGVNVFSGQTVSGNLCFEVAENDASTLLLGVNYVRIGPTDQTVWFALR
jgi:hypothetical protein